MAMVKPTQKAPQRFEVWLINLDPTQGSEIHKTRPCLVISPNEMAALKTAIVAPMSSKGFPYPSRIAVHFQEKNGLILLDQMRAVDKSRLIKKLGVIGKPTQTQVTECLLALFAT